MTEPPYSKEEFARRGDALYEERIEPGLVAEDEGKFVAIDSGSGDFETAEDELTALDTLRQRRPEAQMWLKRVGRRHAHRIGPSRTGAS